MHIEHGLVFVRELDLNLLPEGRLADRFELEDIRVVLERDNERVDSASDVDRRLVVPDGHALLIEHKPEILVLTGFQEMLDMLVNEIAHHENPLALWLELPLLSVHVVELPMAFAKLRCPEVTDFTSLFDTIVTTVVYEGVQVEFQSRQVNTKFIKLSIIWTANYKKIYL